MYNFFYIPGAESLNILYMLVERHGNNLIVFTPSISVIKVCEIMEVDYKIPEFCKPINESGKKFVLRYFKKFSRSIFFIDLITKLYEFYYILIKKKQVNKLVKSMPSGSFFYYSTFFFDVPGILFLEAVVSSKKISTKILWPSEIRFTKTKKPSLCTIAFFLNFLTSNLFAFHSHISGKRIIGINPEYLNIKNLIFSDENESLKSGLPEKYINAALSQLDINFKSQPRVLILGEYSVEQGIIKYGAVYLQVLKLLGEVNGIDVYYKPHPLYHSIIHPCLSGLSVLDTQIPVEFLDDGSWAYIISFFSASIMTSKVSKCICLLKLKELEINSIDLAKMLELNEKSVNEIIYPKELAEFEWLLKKIIKQNNYK